MKKLVYTLGYTTFNIEDFLKELKKYGITCVIDVRSTPKSQYYKDYDSKNLTKVLKKEGVLYRNYAFEFGARQNDKKLYPNGYLDFDLFSKTDNFKQGVKKLDAGVEMGQIFALMCAEKDPSKCHRTILVSRFLQDYGYEINHIIDKNKIITQKEIEKDLVDYYFFKGKKSEPTLFDFLNDETVYLSDEEYIKRSYQKRNKEIGFEIECVQ